MNVLSSGTRLNITVPTKGIKTNGYHPQFFRIVLINFLESFDTDTTPFLGIFVGGDAPKEASP